MQAHRESGARSTTSNRTGLMAGDRTTANWLFSTGWAYVQGTRVNMRGVRRLAGPGIDALEATGMCSDPVR